MNIYTDHAHSLTACTCKVYDDGSSYVCGECSAVQTEIWKSERIIQEADDTLYKFTMEIKSDIPMANVKHGAFTVYGVSKVTRICTLKQFNQDYDSFIKSGGKVISFDYEINVGKCPECGEASGTDRSHYCEPCAKKQPVKCPECKDIVHPDFMTEHGICKVCQDKRTEDFRESFKEKVFTMQLADLVGYVHQKV